jgi:antitoxin HigA-1
MATDYAKEKKSVAQALSDFLKEVGMNEHSLGVALQTSNNRILQILQGRRALTLETALMLARFFGTTPQYWLQLQMEEDVRDKAGQWAEALARIRPHPSAVERRKNFQLAEDEENERLQEEERRTMEERRQRVAQISDDSVVAFDVLTREPTHFDIISQRTGFEAGQLSAILTMMEFEDDLIVRHAGDWYSLAPIKTF